MGSGTPQTMGSRFMLFYVERACNLQARHAQTLEQLLADVKAYEVQHAYTNSGKLPSKLEAKASLDSHLVLQVCGTLQFNEPGKAEKIILAQKRRRTIFNPCKERAHLEIQFLLLFSLELGSIACIFPFLWTDHYITAPIARLRIALSMFVDERASTVTWDSSQFVNHDLRHVEIVTNRLVIKANTADDRCLFDNQMEMYGRQDRWNHLRFWGPQRVLSEEEIKGRCSRIVRRWDTVLGSSKVREGPNTQSMSWTVRDKWGQCVGFVLTDMNVRLDTPCGEVISTEVAVGILPEQQGRGYALEAIANVVERLAEADLMMKSGQGLVAVHATIHPENARCWSLGSALTAVQYGGVTVQRLSSMTNYAGQARDATWNPAQFVNHDLRHVEIVTNRLVIKANTANDKRFFESQMEMYGRQDRWNHLRYWGPQRVLSEEEIKGRCSRIVRRWDTVLGSSKVREGPDTQSMSWTVRDKWGQCVGFVLTDMNVRLDTACGEVISTEVAVGILPEQQGRGYALEAIANVVERVAEADLMMKSRLSSMTNYAGQARDGILVQGTRRALLAEMRHLSGRTTYKLDYDWRFNLGDIPAASDPSFNDNVPHDFVVEGTFTPSADMSHGWYRKTFVVPEELRGRSAWLTFDGVQTQARVYINGALVRTHDTGYTTFQAPADALVPGARNVIAVRVDSTPDSWWYDGGGIYDVSDERVIDAGASGLVVSQRLVVDRARLWSIDSPALYSLETAIIINGTAVDVLETPFGFRKIAFDAKDGFFLNDQSVKIKGMCSHQDFAGLGVAVPDSVQTWRVKLLKEMGSNAWRTVWDENHRNNADAQGIEDLKAMLYRDRNHPSIIYWSLCNEALCNSFDAHNAKVLADIIHQIDPTRPVTAAMNQGYDMEFPKYLDVVGINYHTWEYDPYHAKHPSAPMTGSETSSALTDRGVYVTDAARGYISAYDVNKPDWGDTAEGAWNPISERQFMEGAFIWTAFDYKGEPTPYEWPNINSHFGVIDIAGFPKDAFYLYQSMWKSEPVLHLLPHWNGLPGFTDDGAKGVEVWAYTNAPVVELFVNGRSQGARQVARNGHASWTVPYEPGTLSAMAYDASGALIASEAIHTTSGPAAITLEAQMNGREAIEADGQDVALVKVAIVDSAGRVVPTASNFLTFSIDGVGSVVGVGNGDPSCHEPDKASTRSAWNGLALFTVALALDLLRAAARAQCEGAGVEAYDTGLASASWAFTDNDHAEYAQLFTPPHVPWRYTSVCAVLIYLKEGGGTIAVHVHEEDPLTGSPLLNASSSATFFREVITSPRVYIGVEFVNIECDLGAGGQWRKYKADGITDEISSLYIRATGQRARALPPRGWNCSVNMYADGSSCDCQCGARDPDCEAVVKGPLSSSCPQGSVCSRSGTCIVDCWFGRCMVPANWSCLSSEYGDGSSCNCGCGAYDKDCDNRSLQMGGCTSLTSVTVICNMNGVCVVPGCGNNISDLDNEASEQCDGGLGCIDCICDSKHVPKNKTTTPDARSCDLACGNKRIDTDKGEECDGGTGCTKECMCGNGYRPTTPRLLCTKTHKQVNILVIALPVGLGVPLLAAMTIGGVLLAIHWYY
eukprot:m51a1_g2123 putative C-tail anchored protein, Glycoside hydrolase family domain (1594) ;mRNA; f:1670213-1679522